MDERLAGSSSAKVSSDRAFLEGGGELGALMRTHDWSNSPLGAPETWPQSLRAIVTLMLHSKFPMFVAWGSELGFLYNDPYAEILGAKHPRSLGASLLRHLVGNLARHQPVDRRRACAARRLIAKTCRS